MVGMARNTLFFLCPPAVCRTSFTSPPPRDGPDTTTRPRPPLLADDDPGLLRPRRRNADDETEAPDQAGIRLVVSPGHLIRDIPPHPLTHAEDQRIHGSVEQVADAVGP